MANNKIQIKRSTSNATVTGLSAGELAYTAAGDILYIGAPADGSSVRIGGLQVPGVLTANQALVANATSGIDKVIVANLVPTTVWANGTSGTAGQLLTSNSTGVYWSTPAASVAGSDTQVQFNDGGTLGADAGFTFNKTTDALTVNGSFTTGDTGVGTGGFLANDTIVLVGNNSSNTTISASGLTVNGTVVIANNSGVFTTGTVNSTSFTAGATGAGTGGTVSNTTNVFVGNNTINTNISAASVITQNATGIATLTPISLTLGNSTITTVPSVLVGNATVNSIHNSSSFSITGNTTTLSTVTVSSSGLVGGNGSTTSTSMIITVANSISNAQMTPALISVSNSTTNTQLSRASLFVGNTTVNSIHNSSAFSITGNATLLSTVTLSGTGLVAGNNSTTNTSMLITVANSVGNVQISPISVRVSNATSNTFVANVSQVTASVPIVGTDMTLSGNLVVSGTVVTVNTSQLTVNDNIIELALNNTTTDLVDTGFFSPAGNASSIWYSGIARIAALSTNSAPVFRVFGSNTNPNTSSTIDTSSNTTTGFLQSYLIPYGASGPLVVNSTNITISGNSTLTVSVSANTLTLSGRANNDLLYSNGTGGVNGLALGTSGYVLQSNGTAIVYDTLDGGTF